MFCLDKRRILSKTGVQESGFWPCPVNPLYALQKHRGLRKHFVNSSLLDPYISLPFSKRRVKTNLYKGTKVAWIFSKAVTLCFSQFLWAIFPCLLVSNIEYLLNRFGTALEASEKLWIKASLSSLETYILKTNIK